MTCERRRRSIRPRGHDHAVPGGHFVTIRMRDRACVFGEINDGVMVCNKTARRDAWDAPPNHNRSVLLDAFAVMANHAHGIAIITKIVGAGFKPAPTTTNERTPTRHGLTEIVRAFETFSARRVNEMRETPRASFWQRNYYERVMRVADELNRVRQYVAEDAARWHADTNNPVNIAQTVGAWHAAPGWNADVAIMQTAGGYAV